MKYLKLKYILTVVFIFTLLSCKNSELAKAQKENKELAKKYNDARVKLAELKVKQEYNEKELKRLNKELAELKKQLDKVSKERNKLLATSTTDAARLKMLDERYKELKKQISALEKQKNKLEAANNKIKLASDKELQQMRTKLAKFEVDRIKLQQQLKNAEQARKKLLEQAQNQNRTADTTQIDNKIEAIKKLLKQREEQIASLKSQIEELKKQIKEQAKAYKNIITKLKKEIKAGQIRARIQGREIRMTLMQKLMFSSGSIKISAKGRRILTILGKELKKLRYGMIYIEGHTDSDKVVAWRIKRIYPTNWEFSVMRAVKVVRYLVERIGLNPKKLIAAGRSMYSPVAPNTTRRKKALNRRIEIFITPKRKIISN